MNRSNTPNGKPTFANKTLVKRVYDKKGKLIVEEIATEVKWPKSKSAKKKIVWIQKLSKMANDGLANPYVLNFVAYTIKELKVRYDRCKVKKWYITYDSFGNKYKPGKDTMLNEINVVIEILKDTELCLSQDTKYSLLKYLIEELVWLFIIDYPRDIDKIPENIRNYILGNEHNRQIYDECLKKYDEKNEGKPGIDLLDM